MYNSIALIRKDFMLTRKFILLLIPYYLIMGYMNAEAYTVFSLFPAMLLLINSCTIDMQHNNQKFLVTLPVPRQRLIQAKYMTLIPFSLFSLTCTILLYLGAFTMGKLDEPLRWRELGIATAAFPLLASIYLPLYYWLGQKGMQIVNFIFIMVIMLNFTAITSLSKRFPALAEWISTGRLENVLLVAISVLAYLVIIYASYLVSLRIYMHKDI
ncbi:MULTISPECIES: ABC-2 transporter permease [unclassified Paenibacillus]|uniref:ABC-2 transporter permease n=1 Tax=unclassified Paenibacillus TaxID=185978 RepID=UPI0030F58625